jgi:hypothetical protein
MKAIIITASILVSIASAIFIWQFSYGMYEQRRIEREKKEAETQAIIDKYSEADRDKKCKARWGYDYSYARMSGDEKVVCCTYNPTICGQLP